MPRSVAAANWESRLPGGAFPPHTQLKTGNIGIGNISRYILPGVTSIARQLQKLVGTAFHRRSRSAVERRPYQNAEVLQLPCRSVKTGQTCFLTFINEPRITKHEPRNFAILPASEKQEKKQA